MIRLIRLLFELDISIIEMVSNFGKAPLQNRRLSVGKGGEQVRLTY